MVEGGMWLQFMPPYCMFLGGFWRGCLVSCYTCLLVSFIFQKTYPPILKIWPYVYGFVCLVSCYTCLLVSSKFKKCDPPILKIWPYVYGFVCLTYLLVTNVQQKMLNFISSNYQRDFLTSDLRRIEWTREPLTWTVNVGTINFLLLRSRVGTDDHTIYILTKEREENIVSWEVPAFHHYSGVFQVHHHHSPVLRKLIRKTKTR